MILVLPVGVWFVAKIGTGQIGVQAENLFSVESRVFSVAKKAVFLRQGHRFGNGDRNQVGLLNLQGGQRGVEVDFLFNVAPQLLKLLNNQKNGDGKERDQHRAGAEHQNFETQAFEAELSKWHKQIFVSSLSIREFSWR